MSADDFIADCFQRDEGCRHGVNTAGVNLDVCSQCVRDAYEAQPSLTPADLIDMRDEMRHELFIIGNHPAIGVDHVMAERWLYQLDTLITRLENRNDTA